MQLIMFEIRGEYITLDNLLKATGLAPTGGAAKQMVAEGKVQVDGREELRKTCKLRPGQVVGVHGARVRLQAAAPEAPEASPTQLSDNANLAPPGATAANESEAN